MGIRDMIERKKAQFKEKRTTDIETRKARLKNVKAERKQREEQHDLRNEEKKEKQKIREFKTARFREIAITVKSLQKKSKSSSHTINPAFGLGSSNKKRKKGKGLFDL